MRSTLRMVRHLAVPGTVVLGILALILPSADAPIAMGLVAAAVTLITISVVASAALRVTVPEGRLAIAAPQGPALAPAQSGPDARGHARPRAPGRLQTAV